MTQLASLTTVGVSYTFQHACHVIVEGTSLVAQ